jgi:hypothetical protein
MQPWLSSSFFSFVQGDIVWAQIEPNSPFWPAFVFEVNSLPTDIKKNLFPHSNSSIITKKKKIPIYLYGRNDYDLVSPKMLKEFSTYADEFSNQAISESLVALFEKGMQLARESTAKSVESRYCTP